MAKSELWLRLARPSEAACIAQLSRDLIEYGLGWRWTPVRVAASVRAPNANVLVACTQAGIAGFAIMRYGDEEAHLDLLAVRPSFRRMGIGGRLLQWLEKCAVTAGVSGITLEVREGNKGAQHFYQRMDYHTLARVPGYYQGVEAALRMRREFPCPSLDPRLRETQTRLLETVFGTASDPLWLR